MMLQSQKDGKDLNITSDPEIADLNSLPRIGQSNEEINNHNQLNSAGSSANGLKNLAAVPENGEADMKLDTQMFANRKRSSQTDFHQESQQRSSQMTGPYVANPQKVLMQINKYVHPCERLPHFVKQEDLATFALDYDKRENERIKAHLVAFDEMVTQTLCGSQDGSKSRIKRYQSDYLPTKGCDHDMEEQLSYVMFIDDIKDLRNMVISFLLDTLSGQLTAEKKFAKEREFFSQQVSNVKQANGELQEKIDQLTKDLSYEKNYNLQLFVDEQVTQMCQRSYFSFNLMAKENQIKAF